MTEKPQEAQEQVPFRGFRGTIAKGLREEEA